jgi:adenosine deaminase
LHESVSGLYSTVKDESMKKLCAIALLALLIKDACGVTYDELRAIPKAELHVHLGGSYPLEYLQTIATPEQYDALQKGIDRFVDGVEYEQCFFVFELITRIVNTDKKIEDGTYAMCKAFEHDGVAYAEIRTGLKDLGGGYEGYLNAVLAGVEKAQSDTFTAKVFLSVKRTSSTAYVRSTIDLALKYKHRGVIGIDISDNSTAGDITPLIPLLQEAQRNGFVIVAHIGESPQEKDQMMILEHLQPDRIGHGVHLVPEAAAWIRAHKTPLEICPSSSVSARMVHAFHEHPGLQLYQEGHPVTIGTDDTLLFRTTLTREYLLFAQQLQLSHKEVHDVIEKSFEYRCL